MKDWDIKIYRGILTGCNEAFIINTKKRDEILKNCKSEDERKRTEEIIRPILRGRDIKRYGYDWAGLWLINTHNGIREKGIPPIDIKQYPTIKAHLDKYWDKISARDDKGVTPYNLRNCAYMDDFSQQKICWARLMRISKNDIQSFPRFALVDNEKFVVDSLCFFTGENLDNLVHLLNSEFATWFFFNSVAILDNGGMQMRQQYIENIPLPELNNNLTKENVNNEIYKALDFSKEEICFIKSVIKAKQNEILANIK